MPLTLYIKRSHINNLKNIVDYNDDLFELQYDSVRIDDNIAKLIFRIDKSKYLGEGKIETRFGEIIGINYLSTGCKTAINVYNNPDTVINCIEAGTNALEEIIKMKNGKVLMEIAPAFNVNYDINVDMIYSGKKVHYKNIESLLDDWEALEG